MSDILKFMTPPKAEDDDSVYTTWNITYLSYTAYNPEMFWETLGIKKLGLPVPPLFDSNYARAIAICTIQEINKKWREADQGKSTFQRDALNQTVHDVSHYYENNPDIFFKKFPDKPVTKDERERLHRYLRGIARWRLDSAPKAVFNQRNRDADNRVYLNDPENDRSQEDMIDSALNNDFVIERDELSDLDQHIISTRLDEAIVTAESKNIISKYFLKNISQVQSVIPYFQNKVIVGLIPQTLWTEVRVFEWKAAEVYSLLEDIDTGVSIGQNGKSYLYMFYLMVCIAALQQKWKTSVQAISETNMIIGRQHIPTLTTLVIKTFLFYAKDLEKNVFTQFDFPPPVTPNDVKEFGNIIKNKPRQLLKSIETPLPSVPKPSKKSKTTKLMNTIVDDSLPEALSFEDVFESYEVFEALTNNIMESFLEGRIKDDPVYYSSEVDFTEPIMVVKLSGKSDLLLEEAAKGPWRVSSDRFKNVEYVLPVVDGEIMEVFKVEKRIPVPAKNQRWTFKGKIADKSIRSKYVGKTIDISKKGAANPVQLFNV